MLFYVCVHAKALFVLQDLKTPQLSRADSKHRLLRATSREIAKTEIPSNSNRMKP